MIYWSRNAFSLVLAMWLSLIFWIIWLFLMEYIVPFSRSTTNIENASIAQYQALSWVEQSLYSISQEPIWFSASSTLNQDTYRSVDYDIRGSGAFIPRGGTWNWLDPNWNRLSQTEPIQLFVGDDRITSLQLRLRVPRFWGTNQSIIWWADPLVLWQLSSWDSTLIASNSWSNVWMTYYLNIPPNSWILTRNLFTRRGNPIDDNTSTITFSSFYASNCWPWNECVLRISLINRLLQWTTELPFLEYQINTGTRNIPYQITDIETTGTSYWFSRRYNVRVPQATTSAAFDFTVFQ